jgi:hypothetical protein
MTNLGHFPSKFSTGMMMHKGTPNFVSPRVKGVFTIVCMQTIMPYTTIFERPASPIHIGALHNYTYFQLATAQLHPYVPMQETLLLCSAKLYPFYVTGMGKESPTYVLEITYPK